MKYYIFSLSIFVLFAACQQNDIASTDTPQETEAVASPLTLENISQNERIKIGPIQRKVMTQHIQATGRLAVPPTKQIVIHSRIEGQVKQLRYLPGDYVKKGALVAYVENPTLVEKQQQLLETKALLSFAQKDLERKKRLQAGDATTQKRFEESQKEVELLQATYAGLKQSLNLLGVNVLQLESEQTFQWRVPIYAPQAGVVQMVHVHEGQAISPEQAILKLLNPEHLHLELQVLAQDITGLKKGQTVRFSLPNEAKQYEATIAKINPMVNPETNTLMVHGHLMAKDKADFVAGVFVQATIEKGNQEVAGLPLQAVVKEGETYFAYRVQDEKVVKTLLKNASAHDNFVIWEGDTAGEWVVEGGYYVEG